MKIVHENGNGMCLLNELKMPENSASDGCPVLYGHQAARAQSLFIMDVIKHKIFSPGV